MTSEQIIQRLLDEKKISVKEAMIILKDLAKIGIQYIFTKETDLVPHQPTVVMYGVGTTWTADTSNTTDAFASTVSTSTNDNIDFSF